jgi:outer membrane protease
MNTKYISLLMILPVITVHCINAQFYFAHKTSYGIMSGYCSYEIEATEFVPEYNLNAKIKSKLEFPLDIRLGGIQYEAYYILDSKKTVQIDLRLYTDLTDPSSKMKDDDWVMGYLISSTKSDAEVNAFITDIGAYLNYSLSPKVRLIGGLAYKYQKFSYNIHGIKGWQLDEQLERVYFGGIDHYKVLDYEVTSFLPSIRIGGIYDAFSDVKVNANIAYSPLAEVVDEDDHILRGKIIKGKCDDGSATIIELGLHWNITNKLFLNFNYENLSLTLKGKQRQYYYDDDPGTPDDNEKGYSVSGIKLENHNEYSIYRISFGYHL